MKVDECGTPVSVPSICLKTQWRSCALCRLRESRLASRHAQETRTGPISCCPSSTSTSTFPSERFTRGRRSPTSAGCRQPVEFRTQT
ncbi:hypothetical protein AOLI_G00153560 [Acnodon oligacanthus]